MVMDQQAPSALMCCPQHALQWALLCRFFEKKIGLTDGLQEVMAECFPHFQVQPLPQTLQHQQALAKLSGVVLPST